MRTRTIFYINVGHLPKDKAMAYLEQMKQQWKDQAQSIPGDQVLYVPVRDVDTHVEVLIYPQD